MLVFDELSTVASGYAQLGGSDVVAQVGRCINALRKCRNGSNRLVAIGHENDADLHPILRKQSDAVLQAEGKVDEGLIDKATVYQGCQDYPQDEDWFRVKGVEDVPEDSDWSYNTNSFAHLDFDLDDLENQIQRGKLVDDWRAFQDGDEGETDDMRYCPVLKDDNDRCHAATKHLSGVCENHRRH